MEDSQILNIFKDGILVDVNVSYWSGAKMLTATDLGLEEKNIVDAFRLGKKLLIPARVMQEIRRIEGRARATVEEKSFRFNIGNAKFVPRTVFPKVVEALKVHQQDYMEKVNDLITNFEQYKAEMQPIYKQAAEEAWIQSTPTVEVIGPDYDREALKAKFIEDFVARINSYYPPAESLRARFSLSWAVYEIAPVKSLDDEYRTQMSTKINDFVSDVVSVLRTEAIEVCNRIAGNITEGKVVRSNTLDSLRAFIDKFKDLNFVGDQSMEEALEKVRTEILDAYPPEQFHDNQELKSELKRRLVLIAEQAQSMTDINSVTGQYKRKIQFDNTAAQ